ncbi:MAG: inovirus Gp2 family protein [Moraxellaceae bacterium]|jgi:hypothetical protein|nr:inovirus Gp2 family protein [Moraxellaceae bacterium]
MKGKSKLDRLADRRKELSALYEELHFQWRANFFEGSAAGLQRKSPVNFERMAQVEDLVLLIERDERPAFTLTPRHKMEPEVRANPVGQVLLRLDSFCQFAIRRQYRLSPRVRLLLEQLEISRQLPGPPFPPSLDGTRKVKDLLLLEVYALNCLVDRVRQALVMPEYRRELSKERATADRRYDETSSYVAGLIRRVGEVVVIPLEITAAYDWRRTAEMKEGAASRPALVEWFNSFKTKVRHDPVMKHVIGFVGRWDLADYIGLYAKVLFFLDATRVPDGKAAADAIGNLWVEFSEKKGGAYPFYLTGADSDKTVTVLQVGKKNSAQRRQLLDVALLYLCKQDMVYRDTTLEFDRFFRGEIRGGKKAKGDGGRPSITEATKATAVAVDLVGGGGPTSGLAAGATGQRVALESDGTASPQPDTDSSPTHQASSEATEPIPTCPQPSLKSHRSRPKVVVVPRRNRQYLERPRDEESGET